MKPDISTSDGVLTIEPFDCRMTGPVRQQQIDLVPFAGTRMRIWLDHNGRLSTDPKKDHYWQLAQIDVPPLQYQQPEPDPDTIESPGEDSGENPGDAPGGKALVPTLDLTGVAIETWELPL